MTPESRVGIIDFRPADVSVYELVGGMQTFQRLADVFYSRVDSEPILRHMFPESLDEAKEHLALFLAQFFGGPTEYNEVRGAPRLRMRHAPFKIGQIERDTWLGHMLAAMDEIAIPEPSRSLMRHYFAETATFLINAPPD